MKAHRATFPLAVMCRVLGLSPSGYNDWLRRPPSARARRAAELKGAILAIWIESGGVYGSPRIHAALRARGERVGRKRVARLMGELGIEGVTRRRFRGTTKRNAKARPAPDLVRRNFSAEGPERLWVADITHVRTRAGWLHLAVVLDAWSRRIVGWAMAPRMPAGAGTAEALRSARRARGARRFSPPLGGRENQIRHHQPQQLTVRESGAGPPPQAVRYSRFRSFPLATDHRSSGLAYRHRSRTVRATA